MRLFVPTLGFRVWSEHSFRPNISPRLWNGNILKYLCTIEKAEGRSGLEMSIEAVRNFPIAAFSFPLSQAP